MVRLIALTVPNNDSIIRHCSVAGLNDDGSVGVGAFFRSQRHAYLSVNWLQGAQGESTEAKWRETLRLIRGCRTVKPTHVLAALLAGTVRELHTIESLACVLTVDHKPTKENRPHSGISGVPIETDPAALAVAQALATHVTEQRRVDRI